MSNRTTYGKDFASRVLPALALAVITTLLPAPGLAAGRCTDTAKALFRGCGGTVQADWWVAFAKCINLSDQGARAECQVQAAGERREADRGCKEQLDWQLEGCDLLGEGRYDPTFDPQDFDADPAHPSHPNPWFPLAVGNRWELSAGDEHSVLEVLDRTKLIEGVRCIVVRDTVTRAGELHEDTDDWFALAKNGDVWYCGEEVKNYQSFAGDAPRLPELVNNHGSFKAGRNGDKPGILFLGTPHEGDVYVEEFSLANAQDVAEVLSTTYSYGHDAELDELVPAALAQALCNGDCVVTRNISLLDPGVRERKYYAPGIGNFLEVEPEEGVAVRLVACNVDPRCATLPQP